MALDQLTEAVKRGILMDESRPTQVEKKINSRYNNNPVQEEETMRDSQKEITDEEYFK